LIELNKVIKLNILLTLLLAHIDVSDFLTVILGFVLVAEIPEATKRQLIDGLQEMIGVIEP
jgi:hypothetical protein